MSQCAKTCKSEGGGVCVAFSFCWVRRAAAGGGRRWGAQEQCQ